MYLRRAVLAGFFACSALPASAEAWSCSGEGLAQVSCDAKTCAASAEPVSIQASANSTGKISVCIAVGCWEGRGSVAGQDGRFASFVGLGLPWSHTPEATDDVALTIDKESGFAALMADGFITPLRCEARP